MADECLFCSIVSGDIPAKKIFEDAKHLAFLDINPRNPGHTLVIPKKHYETIVDMPAAEVGALFTTVKDIAAKVLNGVKAQGISIAQSNGRVSGQIVPHVHVHIIPRFVNEGPIGLEGILQVKKMDEPSLDKVVEAIKGAEKAVARPQVRKKPKGKEDEISEDDFADVEEERKGEINFDF